jgi:hypothetical protein
MWGHVHALGSAASIVINRISPRPSGFVTDHVVEHSSAR